VYKHHLKQLAKKLHYHDVLIQPRPSEINSRADVNVKMYYGNHMDSYIPVVVANMDTTGTFSMADSLRPFNIGVALHKFYPTEKLIQYYNNRQNRNAFYTVGISKEEFKKFNYIHDRLKDGHFPSWLILDTPNAYIPSCITQFNRLSMLYSPDCIIVGNVCTPEGVELLARAGVKFVKIGIAQGGVCETALKAGVGYPQLSAVIECSMAAKERGIKICADGGIKNPADICKALVAGADMVMCGSIFSGYDECEGEWQYQEELVINPLEDSFTYRTTEVKKYLQFYGMASREANNKHYGGMSDYKTSEGKCITVPYKGKVESLAKDIRGSLASCGTMINAKSVNEFYNQGEFILI